MAWMNPDHLQVLRYAIRATKYSTHTLAPADLRALDACIDLCPGPALARMRVEDVAHRAGMRPEHAAKSVRVLVLCGFLVRQIDRDGFRSYRLSIPTRQKAA